jgi:hypothetical protein
MLSLDSPRWNELQSRGGTGALTARLLKRVRAGDLAALTELYEQCCHQTSPGEVAFAAIPHLIDIARGLPELNRIAPLVIAGTVKAGCDARPSEAPAIPSDLRADYEAAAREALRMAATSLNTTGLERGQVVSLLGVVAAYQGHCDLAMHLFLHGGSDHDLSCPECGEYIRFRE